MSLGRQIIVMVVAIAAFMPNAQANNNAETNAFVVFALGKNINHELADDVTEAVIFAVAKDKGFTFLPKEKIQSQVRYSSPTQAGNCIFDNECLRKVRATLKTRRFVIAKLTEEDQRYRLIITRIGATSATDISVAAEVPKATSDIINKARSLLIDVLKDSKATLVFSVNESDATVKVNGKLIGKGSTRTTVEPGQHTVMVEKKGFFPFNSKLKCSAGAECIITANITRRPKVIITPLPTVTALESSQNTGETWRIVGWSTAGAGLALLTVATVANIQAGNIEDELNGVCKSSNVCSISKVDAEKRERSGRSWATTSKVTGGLGGALIFGGVSALVYGYMIAPDEGSNAQTMSIVPILGVDGTLGFSATARF